MHFSPLKITRNHCSHLQPQLDTALHEAGGFVRSPRSEPCDGALGGFCSLLPSVSPYSTVILLLTK